MRRTQLPGRRSGSRAASSSWTSAFRVSTVRPAAGMASGRSREVHEDLLDLPGVAQVGHSPGSAFTTRRTSSPSTRWSSFSLPRTTAFRSREVGEMSCLRAKASSCRSVARALAGRVDLLDLLVVHGEPGRAVLPHDLRAAEDDGEEVVEVVATPPARRPTLSSFWAWRNCASSRLCAVMSLVSARAPGRPIGEEIPAWSVDAAPAAPCAGREGRGRGGARPGQDPLHDRGRPADRRVGQVEEDRPSTLPAPIPALGGAGLQKVIRASRRGARSSRSSAR